MRGDRLFALALAGSAAAGVLVAVQSRINGQLSDGLGRPLAAALWSFGSGLVLLTLLLLVPSIRQGVLRIPAAVRRGRLRWWECAGGLAGALFVSAQTYAVPLVGVALSSVAVVGGQTLSGLAVDRLGIPAEAVAFQSSNAWDAHAASAFGLRVGWCNRSGQNREHLPGSPDREVRSLAELPALLGL